MMPRPIPRGTSTSSAGRTAGLSRLLPQPNDPLLAIDLPRIESADDVAKAGAAVIASVAAGEITLREAQGMMKLLTAHARLLTAAGRARRGTGR
ncbi:hypothetical protein [Allosphingosinicella deserti]|uniref:Uncharacterized protein n=1 Tax=Allosphingosinicella deserti TaxID=2116704 RepID=A0A2P7QIE1_9SPHN|nr:hypothetical protein [Sphingomonas deserti]PSJ37732.1 hypothetical protein C7I55_22005 [Sphingomonas deserti]